MFWAAPGTQDYYHGQSSAQGGFPHPGTHAGGTWVDPKGFDALSTGAMSGVPQHLSQEDPLYTLNTAGVMGDSIAAAPAGGGSTGVAGPNPTEFDAPPPRMSKTRTGRKGPRRGLPGRIFESKLDKVQERLMEEGADGGAVECLGSKIFVDGKITQAALKAEMTLDQRKGREGKQKYMLLLKVVPRPENSPTERDHCCLLCPPWARAEFKLREDSLRHFHKDHFGLSFGCKDW